MSDFTFTFHFHALEEEIATDSSVLAWRIPGMGEPSGLPSMGLHKVGQRLKRLSSSRNPIRNSGAKLVLQICISGGQKAEPLYPPTGYLVHSFDVGCPWEGGLTLADSNSQKKTQHRIQLLTFSVAWEVHQSWWENLGSKPEYLLYSLFDLLD